MSLMHRAQSTSSDQEVNEGLAEVELQKLQRQYRLMDGDRKAYSEESRILLQKQKGTIEKLGSENGQLIDELRLLEQRHTSTRRSSAQREKADVMTDQIDAYNRRIRNVVQEIQKMDIQLDTCCKDVAKHRASLGGVDVAKNNDNIYKQIRVLENRLDKSLVKFNKALSVNRELRGNIDGLRRERLVFDGIYRKFERELQDQKKQMAEIIEISNSAYEARDEAQAKIIALRDKAEKEYQAYTQEGKELDRSLEQDRRLKEFMAAKIAERQNNSTGNQKQTENTLKKDRTIGGSQELLAESLTVYERAFKKIKEVTGVTDINELVKRFKQFDDQNFSLFNFVNEINNEIEQMSEEITSIQRKMDCLKIDTISEEEDRTMGMKRLEDQLAHANERRTHYNKVQSEITDIIQDLQNGFDQVNAALHTTPIDVPGSPVYDSGVPEHLLNNLSAVEQRTNELLLMNLVLFNSKRSVVLEAEPNGTSTIVPIHIGGLLGNGPLAPVGSISIQAPNTGDDYDFEEELSDEDDRPLTRDELTTKTLKGITKRERNANARPGSGTKIRRRGKKSANE